MSNPHGGLADHVDEEDNGSVIRRLPETVTHWQPCFSGKDIADIPWYRNGSRAAPPTAMWMMRTNWRGERFVTPLADSQNGNLIKTAIAMHVDGEENTMNELKIFEPPDFGKIRTVTIDDEPYLVGKDIAGVLGYADLNKAIAMHVDEEDKLNDKTSSSLGQRGGWLINESGLYSLILGSKLPGAKKFKCWVTSEVLPSIRVRSLLQSSTRLQ